LLARNGAATEEVGEHLSPFQRDTKQQTADAESDTARYKRPERERHGKDEQTNNLK
jgi:hypothetical protein